MKILVGCDEALSNGEKSVRRMNSSSFSVTNSDSTHLFDSLVSACI